MSDRHNLDSLSSQTFEHLVNSIALKVLGSGLASFSQGPDGGRDGYFKGSAPYPSMTEKWSGVWYIQSKFREPNLGGSAHQWLLGKIEEELKLFADENNERVWPDIWIVASNIDPSGAMNTGVFDRAKALVAKYKPGLEDKFDIWGGSRLIDYLSEYEHIAARYGHFLTPGHVVHEMLTTLKQDRVQIKTIMRYLTVTSFENQYHMKLEQAGASSDTRPGIHELYTDVPFASFCEEDPDYPQLALKVLASTVAESHSPKPKEQSKNDDEWDRMPCRAKNWFIKAGPGHGKSTIGQYISQIHRCALVDHESSQFNVSRDTSEKIKSLKKSSIEKGFWPSSPRIPIYLELNKYASWIAIQEDQSPVGILTYLSAFLTKEVQQNVSVGLVRSLLELRSWIFIFDGLDEVPQSLKDVTSKQVVLFLTNDSLECSSDCVAICTSRPQGYSGQFDALHATPIILKSLSPEQALQTALPVIKMGRSIEESNRYYGILKLAAESPAVMELMTTPLQAHIMAIVVRDGGRPPEQKWQLYNTFYDVIKRREANKEYIEAPLRELLQKNDQLLRTVHNRLGFSLHALAETKEGANAFLTRAQFKELVTKVANDLLDDDIEETVSVLMDATENRLVLVSTPQDRDKIQFDIRQLQEFFAAEHLHERVDHTTINQRLLLLRGDAHWQEVVHFMISGLLAKDKQSELNNAALCLIGLDEGDADETNRLLHRRLCRGANTVAYLLVDGVLEQDKASRNRFVKILDSVAASHDRSLSYQLGNLTHKNSKNWLIKGLREKLSEANVSEVVGGSRILAYQLSDKDIDDDLYKYCKRSIQRPLCFVAGGVKVS